LSCGHLATRAPQVVKPFIARIEQKDTGVAPGVQLQ
jgi:hypothetical protein